ncbi:MAG: DUF1592 domain-containing protein [Deltaproteobacteria bacterium]|nr:DUF1592 domain-containing protein [Nannocystaceae bacterium]
MTRFSPRASWPIAALLALACASACYTGPAADAAETGDGGEGDEPDALCQDEAPAALPNLVRLTHRQYDNTIRDLVGIEDATSAVFIPDPKLAGFDNNAELLSVGDRLARDYRRAAEDIAGRVVEDPERLAALLPCDDESSACAEQMIDEFGRRAFRRPLAEHERARYLALFSAADGLYDGGSAFEQGVRVVVESMLQSPNVLYRVELSSPDEGDESVPLGGYEIATRLSYLLWNSTPDDALLDAAEAGELDDADGIAEHARRLLDDPRAHDPVADFHAQWLHVDEYLDVAKDPTLFPDWDLELGDAMQQESRRFIERVVFEQAGGFTELMTSPSTVVDTRLAAIYGVQVEGDGFEAVELDPSERAGILTQVGFLASRAYADTTSPIHRGVFVQRALLCAELPEPPPDIDPSLPPLEGEIRTTRDAVTVHTSPDECAGCHTLINLPGFALEGYDAIGRVRDQDNGWPVDAAVTMTLDDAPVEIDGGVELAAAIAASPSAQRCYVRQWFRYASMRKDNPDDACTIDGLHAALTDPNAEVALSVQDLMVALTQTRAFRNRGSAP